MSDGISNATDVVENNDTEDTVRDEDYNDPLPNTATTEIEENINGEVRYRDNNSRNIFQARVFAEQNSNVYGAEVVVFGSETAEPIEKILITDVTDFDSLSVIVDNLQNALVPYTKSDFENLQIIRDYLDDMEDIGKANKFNSITWSKLHNKGDLETILDNNSGLDSTVREEYLDLNDKVVINATHLNGYVDSDFSLATHNHDNHYLTNSHLNLVGDSSNRGHVSIVDNLDTTSVGGTALSANQGNVLKNQIKSLSDDVYRGWSVVTNATHYTLRVNELLHLAVCDYNRLDYTGLKSKTGNHTLHKEGTIPSKYAPSSRVVTPVYNSTVTMMFERNGGIDIYNTVKHDSWNIHVQVMWYYR